MKAFLLVLLGLLALVLTGCASAAEFNKDDAKGILESNPLQLSAEQVQLANDQVNCGDQEDLWRLTQLGPGRAVGRLTDKGRALGFSDDVRVGSPTSTAQVTGKFSLRVNQVLSMEDDGADTKKLEVQTGIVLNNRCFERAPLLLGIRRGEFTASASPRFRLREGSPIELLH